MLDISGVPLDPGCYLYRDANGEVIYVGKAKSLRKRVRSYFQGNITDPKTSLLVSEISSVDYYVTSTEVEALLLEYNLINKYKPRYNISLKESHRYAYIRISDEDFPRLLVARDKEAPGKYYGPFVNAEDRDNIIKALRKAFGIRTCKRMRRSPCLRYHIGLCSAPCIGNISKGEYNGRIRSIERFLDGRVGDLVRDLKDEMELMSSEKSYEKAMMLRDQIQALSSLLERQHVERDKSYDEDIINYIVDIDNVCLMVFNVERGTLGAKSEFSFPYIEGFLDEFIIQYYSENDVPKEIIIPHELSDDAIAPFLIEKRGRPVKLKVPKRGRKKDLLDLVRRNIEARFLEGKNMVSALREQLRLEKDPKVIECIDISHISGSYTVGSLVQFRDGKPDKSNYRRFKIRTVDGIDDFSAVAEVVRRRYKRLMSEGSRMPDLVVIDGGKGQLTAALGELRSLGLKVPVISLAKKNEEVYVPGLSKPLDIPRRSKAINLLVQLRDESHRFALEYNKLLRSKGMFKDV
ncbi:MAG: excinuclease ABC subunit C [Candidatus Methanofastidiosa archaeon]|nr:excinuclease ABC subunit C [Candidatus Methanofastidiosa archaeon]